MKFGDLREDGYVFVGKFKSGRRAGKEGYLSPEAFARRKKAIDDQTRKYHEDPQYRSGILKRVRAYYREDYRRQMLQMAKRRAKKDGLPCDLESIEDIPRPTHCPVLGIELVMGTRHNGPNSPSLDKIVPELGYVKGNIVVVSLRANQIKSDATIEELQAVAKFYKRFQKRK